MHVTRHVPQQPEELMTMQLYLLLNMIGKNINFVFIGTNMP